ncbi:Isotrichodermin C-15 hydroxylase 15 [Colletotrichum chlorophyti]|uniref:Isotrichodermin C-15 hydroxylase 15 n=1 Tax=Colletotrichum chlorophyti TaxID=708187 RepID=A0A1Q8RBJ4_9PEZI|nr:Isotrichodermin C-15 hydroxylase 15 [Colletotrichum chlorophyti]
MAIMSTLVLALCLGSGVTTVYVASYIIYNLFFHPLRHFPGPLLMRATRATYFYRLARGTLSFDVLDLHRKYGDVVRIAPDELAFADPAAWKDIMGHRTGGGAQPAFEKSDMFYRPITDLPRDIITAKGPEHAMLRRQMAHGFSEKSLREQQSIIMRYVDLFIQRLREAGGGSGAVERQAVDLAFWYNCCSFDVIGDLAFGEPFGCLEEGEMHPWVRTIFQMVRLGVALQTANHYSVMRKFITRVMSSRAMRERRQQHRDMTMQKVIRRIELGEKGPRNDLIEGLLRKKDEWNLSLEQLEGNASILIIAGSETTATLLSGVTYLLLKNPSKMEKLVAEVRTLFNKEEEIDLTSVNKLTYMLACLDEALRMYPPVPTGLPRLVPEGGAMVCGRLIPEKTTVSIHQWATYHNEKNFKDPFKFHPERFLGDEKYASDRREALQPFHVGPRNCLGRNLAYTEMRIMLARLIWNFDLVLADDSRGWMEKQKIYTLWEKGSLNVYLRPVVRD